MALNITITYPNGVSTSYHKILTATGSINYQNNPDNTPIAQETIVILHYVSETQRETEKTANPPIEEGSLAYCGESLIIDPAYLITAGNIIVTDIPTLYTYLKTLPDYSGATDC